MSDAGPVAFSILVWCGLIYWWMRRRKKNRAIVEASAFPVAPGQLKGDAFMAHHLPPLLEPGEEIAAQAYFTSHDFRPPTMAGKGAAGAVAVLAAVSGASGAGAMLGAASQKAGYAALTDRRLVVIQARVGAFGPLFENRGVVEIPRGGITSVTQQGDRLRFELAGGTGFSLVTPAAKKHFANQARFAEVVLGAFARAA
ncbi:MAG: hypothetical protein H0T46_27450 [Deltaproteobacteria bacterium]|nr:hypothetical protein [Deltaproteobacteria bacterium]